MAGNKDRHHFYSFTRYGNDSYYILIDNGKGWAIVNWIWKLLCNCNRLELNAELIKWFLQIKY